MEHGLPDRAEKQSEFVGVRYRGVAPSGGSDVVGHAG